MKIGDEVLAKVKVNFQGFNITFEQKAKLLRLESDTDIAAFEFVDLKDREEEILKFLSTQVVQGKIASFEDTLRRIDVPISPVSLKPEGNAKEELPIHRRPLSRIIIGILYIFAGIIVGLLVLKTLHAYLFKVRVETAVVEAPIEIIASPASGILDQYYVNAEQSFREQQPLFRVKDLDMLQNYQMALIAISESENDIGHLESTLKSEKEKLEFYRTVSESKEKIAKENLQSAKDQLELEKNNLQRYQNLKEKGYVSHFVFDKTQQNAVKKSNDVSVNQLILNTESHTLEGIDQGFYFSSEKIESDISVTAHELDKARKNLEEERKRASSWKNKIKELTVKAPFNGRVIKQSAVIGNPIAFGKPVMIVERDEQRLIYAYLTQNEVAKIKLGSEASIFVPAQDSYYSGRVIKIDRTSGFVDEMNERYRYRTTRDRSALAIIVITEASPHEIREKLLPGLPVIVTFNKT
ncbi:MAG: HlyD family efflux transporter periplasmic adaptor subunit [Gammaproteobacteria bacterium]|nr:HlyD family efflux transporter periplasmic adaptor subunit [Gammaproteobacteria bacterium]